VTQRHIRAFFAVELPPALRQTIARHVSELARAAPAEVRWTAEENYHVTLKFLGDVAEDRVDELVQAASAKLARIGAFQGTLGGFGAFPNARAARIAWVGVSGGSAPLARLARQLDTAAARFGVGRERRPYHAHITVGRLNSPQPLPLQRFAEPLGASFPAAEVILFESRLAPQGPSHVPCARIALCTTPSEPREFDEFAPEI
jgi:2'-5' RNA ligase